MRLTRRGWGFVGAGGVLVGLAVAFADPRLLVGAAALGAWLAVEQYRFVRAARRTADTIVVEQVLAQERVVAERETSVTLAVRLPEPSSLAVTVELAPPVSATGTDREDRRVRLEPGETTASTAVFLEWAVAGTYEFGTPAIEVLGPAGCFTERFERGSTPTMVVEPRGPHDVHVGQGGDPLMAAYGERESGRRDAGLDPGELREYVAGDAAGRIDWKATARMGEPYVREYEIETDIVTAMLVDHRATMADGPTNETKLDYATQVALLFVDSVRSFGDPLGYYAVGDEGLTDRRNPAVGQYSLIEGRLRDLTATDPATTTAGDSGSHSPATSRRAAVRLSGDDAFGRTLRPYFETDDTYAERIRGDPLFETARAHLARLSGTVWTVIFTDDANRAELRETVRLARRGDGRVLVFLTPSALFEPGGLTDLEASYERYREFESFRLELARLRRVSAFEVGPRDRIDAILSSARRRASSRNTQ
ncbi:DUF58 domain-containing protein [Halococcus salsus]|uniref:DUF58 domain-containing protein n=1 Tax=Halococcus salsus TaxID=2162894 RepID=UPI00135C08D0|nr:DUF58 domain-containing protein [Halococcus salsus]